MSRHLLDQLWDSLPNEAAQNELHPQFQQIELIRRGVELAEQREKHPSYAMELKGLLEMVEDLL
jgi:hypothetical protein